VKTCTLVVNQRVSNEAVSSNRISKMGRPFPSTSIFSFNTHIALQPSDVIAIILGLASLAASMAGNIIAYYSLKQLSTKGKHLEMTP
jgi:hypothetical protein